MTSTHYRNSNTQRIPQLEHRAATLIETTIQDIILEEYESTLTDEGHLDAPVIPRLKYFLYQSYEQLKHHGLELEFFTTQRLRDDLYRGQELDLCIKLLVIEIVRRFPSKIAAHAYIGGVIANLKDRFYKYYRIAEEGLQQGGAFDSD